MAIPNPVVGQLQGGVRKIAQFDLNPVDPGGGDPGTGFDPGGGFGPGFGSPIFGPTGDPGTGGPGYGVPPIGGGTTTTTTTVGSATSASFLDSFLKYFTGSGCGIGDLLLRIAFFILGIGAIFAAIYLYKGNNVLLQLPAHLTRAGVKAGKAALAEGAEA